MRKINKTLFFSGFAVLILSLIATSSCSRSKFTSNSSAFLHDPLLKYAWHLFNTGQQVFATTPATPAYDLNLKNTILQKKIIGRGIWVQVSDDGLEDTHEDLQGNFPYLAFSKNYSLSSPYTSTYARPLATADNHGTGVAGIIAASASNGVGSRGVAPGARLTIANFLSDNITATFAMYLDQANGDFDISNMSWGQEQNTIDQPISGYAAQLKHMATTKRNGKGTIFVKAAGNSFVVLCNGSTTSYCIGNSNFDSDNANPYMIVVSALNAIGESATYSSPGSDLWISGFGGEYGDDSPALITTDRTGCSKGYSISSTSTAFEKGSSSENPNCNYTANFNGTSSAAPTITGVVALMLEANPNLTWREVKYILAKTAIADHFATGSIAHPLSYTMPTSYNWEQKWVTNSAGFNFQNWYGFGRVDTDAAVTMAESFIANPVTLGTFTETNWANPQTGLSTSIPDFDTTGASASINVATDLTVESVQIKVAATHADISELALELTSPSGTKSILVNGRNSLTGIANFNNEVFASNAFYQESSLGTWTLKVIDTKASVTGTLTSFQINVFGGAH